MTPWRPGDSLDQAIVWAIFETLLVCRGNKTKAAEMLNVSVRMLRYWIKKHPELEPHRGHTMRDRYPDH
jgi:DNA-binding NtrC family response regulator